MWGVGVVVGYSVGWVQVSVGVVVGVAVGVVLWHAYYMCYECMCGFMLECAVRCMIHVLLSALPLYPPLQSTPFVSVCTCAYWVFQDALIYCPGRNVLHTCTGTEAIAVGIYVFCLVECQTPRGGSGLLCTCSLWFRDSACGHSMNG